MNRLDSVAEEFYQALQEDYVGLWEIVGAVSLDVALKDLDTRTSVLGVVANLLHRGNVAAGKFTSGRFVAWNEVPEQMLKRIDDAWSSLGRNPNIADDICWFHLVEDTQGPDLQQ
jgi:hypothetical protein